RPTSTMRRSRPDAPSSSPLIASSAMAERSGPRPRCGSTRRRQPTRWSTGRSSTNCGTWERSARPSSTKGGRTERLPSDPAGFVPPSLLSIFATAEPFFHNGAAATLTEVMENVTHRSAGTGGVDVLSNPADRDILVKFLLSIDASTTPIDAGLQGTPIVDPYG